MEWPTDPKMRKPTKLVPEYIRNEPTKVFNRWVHGKIYFTSDQKQGSFIREARKMERNMHEDTRKHKNSSIRLKSDCLKKSTRRSEFPKTFTDVWETVQMRQPHDRTKNSVSNQWPR